MLRRNIFLHSLRILTQTMATRRREGFAPAEVCRGKNKTGA